MKMIDWKPKREENENEYGNQKVIDRIGRMSARTPIIRVIVICNIIVII